VGYKKEVVIMKKRFLKYVPIVFLIFIAATGCATNQEHMKKMVQEQVKSELKDIHDFLNVAYAYDKPNALDNIFRMDESLKSVRYEVADLKKQMSESAYGNPDELDLDKINQKIKQELAKMDQKIELRLVSVNDEIGIRLATIDDRIDTRIDNKLEGVKEIVEDNRMRIKEFKFDIKSNRIDITSNRVEIRGTRRDMKDNKQNILENKETILAQKIDFKNGISRNRNDIAELKRSSDKLLLNINNAK
jgi:hypothetical protein